MISPGALQILDTMVAAAVEVPPLNTPPASPAAGACYVVGAAPTGAWSGKAGQVAAFGPGGWRYVVPADGMEVYIKSSGLKGSFRSGQWELGIARVTAVAVGGQQVVGIRQGAIAVPGGGTTIDSAARSAIGEILVALRAHGLIEP